jgi:hypothetical protein
MLDPTSLRAVRSYSDYRQSLRSAEKDPWTPGRVVIEIYATVLHAFLARAQQPFLKVNISVLDQFSPFRLDLSDEYVVLTKEDREAPAVKCVRDSYFYDAYLEELVLHERQAKLITFPTSDLPPLESMSSDVATTLLRDASLFPGCVSVDIDAVLVVARENQNPYA